MRSTTLAVAALFAFTFATAVHAQQDVEVEVEVEEEGGDLGDLGARPRGPQEPAIQYGAHGVYGIVAGTYAAENFKHLKNELEDDLGDPSLDFENTYGLNLRAGYRWHPNMATELEFEWLDSFELDQTASSGGVGEVWSVTANQKAFLSTGRFQLFGIFGMGAYGAADAEAAGVNTDPQGTGFGFRGGAGFNLYINEHFGLNLEGVYNWAVGSMSDLRYTSFSWGFVFNP
jgi:hypothetical protein